MDELARYVFDWCRELMLPEELAVHKHFGVRQKMESAESSAMKERMATNWLSKDPNILRIVDQGESAFYAGVIDRLRSEGKLNGVLNLCSKCGGLARTPIAKQCPHCFYSWH